MKKMFISAALLFTLFACNEKKISPADVPQSVVSGFNTKYPGATDVEWKQEKEDGKWIYEAEFKADGKKKEAHFDSTGNFLKEE